MIRLCDFQVSDTWIMEPTSIRELVNSMKNTQKGDHNDHMISWTYESIALLYLIGLLPIFMPHILLEAPDCNIDRKKMMTYLSRLQKSGVIYSFRVKGQNGARKGYALSPEFKYEYSSAWPAENIVEFQKSLEKSKLYLQGKLLSLFQIVMTRMAWPLPIRNEYMVTGNDRSKYLGEKCRRNAEVRPQAIYRIENHKRISTLFVSPIMAPTEQTQILRELARQYIYVPRQVYGNEKSLSRIRLFLCDGKIGYYPHCFLKKELSEMISEMQDDDTLMSFKEGKYSQIYHEFMELDTNSVSEWTKQDLIAYVDSLDRGQNIWLKEYIIEQQYERSHILFFGIFEKLVNFVGCYLEIGEYYYVADQILDRLLIDEEHVIFAPIGMVQDYLKLMHLDMFREKRRDIKEFLHKYFGKSRYSGKRELRIAKGATNSVEYNYSQTYSIPEEVTICVLFADIDMADAIKMFLALEFDKFKSESIKVVCVFEKVKSFHSIFGILDRMHCNDKYIFTDSHVDEISSFNLYIKESDRFYTRTGPKTFRIYNYNAYDKEANADRV